jgi:hypothetical protein
MFAIVRMGCRQIVVSCTRKFWVSNVTLFKDRHVYSTPVHVVLRDSVQEARKRVSGSQLADSMQYLGYELLRIRLLETVWKVGWKGVNESR